MIKEFIKACKVVDTIIYLPSMDDFQADRNTYTSVKKLFIGWGGVYKRNTFVFKISPQKYIDEYLGDGKSNNIKKDFQFFETPDAVVDQMIDLAELMDTDTILEPSAGRGQIAKRLIDYTLDVIELNDDNREVLTKLNLNIVGNDFMEYTGKYYDKILMNPPFTKGQDVKHILHAYKLLNDGGRIVAIASAGIRFKTDKLTAKLRELCTSIDDLPDKSFKSSGTNVNTVILTIDK